MSDQGINGAIRLAEACRERARSYYAKQHMDPNNVADVAALASEFARIVAEVNAVRFCHVRQLARVNCAYEPACIEDRHDREIVICPGCAFALGILEAE